MSTGPTSAVRRARRDLGARLRAIRRDAGLTARALAAATGQHFTRVSKIENGVQVPTPADVRAWCAACGAGDQAAELLATLNGIESAYREHRRENRAGMRALGPFTMERYERTTQFRFYEHNVIPGLFQTAEYTAAMLGFWYQFLDVPNDLDDAVAARMERQRVLYQPGRRFACVLEEQALRTFLGTAAVQAGQLDRLLAVSSLPNVWLGIVPLMAERPTVSTIGFWMFDDDLVALETPTASIEVHQPEEIALYGRMFEVLRSAAVDGAAARALILKVLDELRTLDEARLQPLGPPGADDDDGHDDPVTTPPDTP